MASHVATAPHETRGIIAWNDHGDAPFWASIKLVRAAGGGGSFTIDVDGETLEVSLGYKENENISPRPSDSVDRIRPTSIYWTDSIGRRFGGHIKPSFKAEEFRQYQSERPFFERDEIFTPPDLGEATRFQILAGKYAEPHYYLEMLPAVLEGLARELSVAWNLEYLRGDPHPEASTIYTHARTLRIDRPSANKLTREDGIFSRIFYLLSSEKGSKIVYTADNSQGVGYYHTVDLDREAASHLLPGAVPGISLKVYYPKFVRSEKRRKDDPLYYPRAEIIFKKSLDGRGRSIDEIGALADRLEEILLNVLNWGGIPIEASTPPYIPDRYQDVEPSSRPLRLFDDPTPQIERDQESALLRTLATASRADVERLGTLLADGGGSRRYDDLADQLEISTSTAYRWIHNLEGLLESDNGLVRFISERQRQLALDVLRPLRDEVDLKAEAIAKILDFNPRLLEQKGSAFQAWITKYGVELISSDNGRLESMKIGAVLDRFQSSAYPLAQSVIEEGLRAWREADQKATEFYNCRIFWYTPDGGKTSRRARTLF